MPAWGCHGGGSALSGLSGGDDAAAPAPGLWEPPEPRGAVCLRLAGEHGVADLTGPAACELLDAEGLAAVRRRLGPDPLRDDGDIEIFVAGVRWLPTLLRRRRDRLLSALFRMLAVRRWQLGPSLSTTLSMDSLTASSLTKVGQLYPHHR